MINLRLRSRHYSSFIIHFSFAQRSEACEQYRHLTPDTCDLAKRSEAKNGIP